MTILTSSKSLSNITALTLLMLIPLFATCQNRAIIISNNETHIKVNDGKNSFELTHQGSLEISDDNTAIISISDNGYFEFTKKQFGKKKKVTINADRNGNLTHEFFIGRKKVPYIPEGQNWMAEMLPIIVSTTNLGGEAKMKRMYKKGGANALLNEMESKKDDHLKKEYFDFLLDQDLTESEMEQTLHLVLKHLSSEHFISDVFENNHRKILKSKHGKAQYLNAIQSMKSSHFKADLLSDYVRHVEVDAKQVKDLMDLISTFKSGHHISEAVEDIAEQRDLSDDALAILITRSMEVTDSGHHKNEILDDIMDHHKLGSKSLSAMYKALANIDSGHYFYEIVDNIVDSQKLNEKELTDLIFVLENLSSDHYLSAALQELADDVLDHQGSAIDAYKKVAKNISSSHHYREVMEAIEE